MIEITRKNREKHIKLLNTDNSGITIVSLVITIVVLLILAGITIGTLVNKDIINLGKKVANKANIEVDETLSEIEELRKELAESFEVKNTEGGSEENPNPDTPEVPKGPNGKPLVDAIEKDDENNQDVEDKNGNPITIPAGFTVVLKSGEKPADKTEEQWNAEKVVYSYNEDGTPAVQDGIVIQDDEGNQFVWIPVGTITNKVRDANGETTTITLGRYEFNLGTYDSTTKIYSGTGEATLKQEATTDESDKDKANYYTKAVTIESYYQELATSSTNTPAKDLKGFIDSIKAKGGYYLARYEASNNGSDVPMSKANQAPWVNITQLNSANYSRNMYSDNSNVKSDLVNSYGWDTAIVFMQKYSGNSKYSIQTTKKTGSSTFNTGTSGDVACNIHDMASNCREWSTEHSIQSGIPCVAKGGQYSNSKLWTTSRNGTKTTHTDTCLSFRMLLY